MNAELVPSELDSEASRPPARLAQVADGSTGGWWENALGRLRVGERARTPEGAAQAFPSTADAVRAARDFVAETVAEWDLPGVVEDLRLVTSELVGNACRHAVPAGVDPADVRVLVQVRLLRDRSAVACVVADSSPGAPTRVDAHHFAESGRGLGLVSAFSREWGWNPVPGHGKVVWAICGVEETRR
ncbi:anti-sigma regulatory factor (Ser/Thr protein kinase) [Nocardiopsis sp. Huas11]|uniref:ATP-binding protein n=1 Tax=Nocardiopsis sp. Huas11 TaxID=2183912 RepID=UPI000EAF3F6F|nr:ATP-binding protein [Nocardiopsis sp. Huas11]RKS05788.1 anti-sigma regulatory factor (Ser/Thr protein kinase) [Nocardiopsis sp. Huas11]